MEKKFLGSIVIAALMAGMPVAASAQSEDGVEVDAGATIVSSYIWRGQDFGGAAIQPSLSVGYKGLSLAAFGSYGFTNSDDTHEFDLTLAYSAGGFSVGATDYYCIVHGLDYADLKYFDYRAHTTAHVFEAFVGYDFGPASLTWYTNIGGADGVNSKGKRAYSSYVEANVPFKLKSLDCSFTAGAVPYATSFYSVADGFAVTNLTLMASKTIKVTPTFSLPLFASITANPSASKCYFTAGLTF